MLRKSQGGLIFSLETEKKKEQVNKERNPPIDPNDHKEGNQETRHANITVAALLRRSGEILNQKYCRRGRAEKSNKETSSI